MFRVIISLLLLLPAWAVADSVTRLNQADFAISDGNNPPPFPGPAWKPIQLQDRWNQHNAEINTAWYRFNISTQHKQENWAVYLHRINQNAAVYFNSELIGDGGSFTKPIAQYWNRPLLFRIPDQLWKPENNTLTIHLVAYRNLGLLEPIQIGELSTLEQRYRIRKFVQNDLSLATFLLVTLGGVIMLVIWRARPNETQYGWFAASALSLTVYGINLFIVNIPIAPEIWWAMVHSGLDLWMGCVCIFMHRMIGIEHKKMEYGFISYAICGAFITANVPMEYLNKSALPLHIPTFLLAIYLAIRLAMDWYQSKRQESKIFLIVVVGMFIFGLHDWLLTSNLFPRMRELHIHMLQFAIPFLFIGLFTHLALRFVTALNEAQRLNDTLNHKLSDMKSALQESYDSIKDHEKREAVIQERERIYNDLHDDVGAKLLSIVYRSSNEDQAELARSAIQDLRTIISTDPARTASLDSSIINWVAEAKLRCDESSKHLETSISALPDFALSEIQRMHLERIVREAISNAIKHGNSTPINLSVYFKNGDLHINIGNGLSTPFNIHHNQGRGIRSMNKRVAALMGEVNWDQNDDLITVHFRIPIG